jgi:hypothetical protein
MVKKRPRVPIGLPIAMVITLLLGIAAGPVLESVVSEQQFATNVLYSAIPFVLIFVAIILGFITLTWFVASLLNDNIPARIYRPIELALIAGIVLGIIGMFQPWFFPAYRYGFLLLLFSTLAFILWSHIVPRGVHHDHLGSVSISEFEKHESGVQ